MAEKEALSGQEKDTLIAGHDADGILEFDNDMPMWWLVGFIFTVVFAFGYLVQYHLAGGPSSGDEYNAEVAAFKKTQEPAGGQDKVEFAALTDAASIEAGKAIFNGTTSMCATCHRNDLGGMVGPNLTDEYWIHGGDFNSIMTSIKTGYPDKGMQRYGSGAPLNAKQVQQVASFIVSMKDSHPANPKAIDPAREIKYEVKHDEAKDVVAGAEKKGEKHEKDAKHEKDEKHADEKKVAPVKAEEKKK